MSVTALLMALPLRSSEAVLVLALPTVTAPVPNADVLPALSVPPLTVVAPV